MMKYQVISSCNQFIRAKLSEAVSVENVHDLYNVTFKSLNGNNTLQGKTIYQKHGKFLHLIKRRYENLLLNERCF